MARVHLDAVAEGRQPLERAEEILRALPGGDREIGPRRVADEERVARQHELVVDDERAVLRPMARRVQDADLGRARAHDVAVGERLAWVLGLGERVDRDGQAVLEGEPAVARDVIGVGVRLEDALDPNAAPRPPPRRTARSRVPGRRPPRRLRRGHRRGTRRTRGRRRRTGGRRAPRAQLNPSGGGRWAEPHVDPDEQGGQSQRSCQRARRRSPPSRGCAPRCRAWCSSPRRARPGR